MRELMRLRADMAAEALRHEDGTLLLAEKEREPIFLGPPLERGTPEDDGLLQTYEVAAGQGVNLELPARGCHGPAGHGDRRPIRRGAVLFQGAPGPQRL